ncbi:hypothetical protein DQ04_20181000 [Trypanosoma grayi]|uniref:hypothetical protein n=1 Tax=Trypanosoma grayi TaxID=71804 RepID=UPI0004F449D0|nr:hypothetical protein DQ04_20181000 [Trypanosoma grayi]KEG05594.1 hypothetical protein DQ04_20181000 [Trypanosoma grayi]
MSSTSPSLSSLSPLAALLLILLLAPSSSSPSSSPPSASSSSLSRAVCRRRVADACASRSRCSCRRFLCSCCLCVFLATTTTPSGVKATRPIHFTTAAENRLKRVTVFASLAYTGATTKNAPRPLHHVCRFFAKRLKCSAPYATSPSPNTANFVLESVSRGTRKSVYASCNNAANACDDSGAVPLV